MGKLIYIADDEKNIRDLIRSFLVNDGFEVAVFDSGDSLYVMFQTKACDLIILDIMMPGTDGLTICSQIRAKSNVPIIIVSAKDSELDRITGITLGSDDYLVKPFSPIELVARVKAIFRRIDLDQNKVYSELLSFGDITLKTTTKEGFLNHAKLDLTPTEFAFLAYLITHQERAVSRAELLKNVWSFAVDTDTRATDDVLKRLRKKMKGSHVLIEAVWGFGFRLTEADHEKPAE
jgi:DNA-binding response OmpR family regulator